MPPMMYAMPPSVGMPPPVNPVNFPPLRPTMGNMPLPGIQQLRSVEETESLRKELYEVFKHEVVDRVLKNHPCEKNIEKLSSHAFDASPMT